MPKPQKLQAAPVTAERWSRPRDPEYGRTWFSFEADLDEVIPGAQRPQVIDALDMVQLRILLDDRLVSRLHQEE